MDFKEASALFPEYKKSLPSDIAFLRSYLSRLREARDKIILSCRTHFDKPDDQDFAIEFYTYFTLGDLPEQITRELDRKERHLRLLKGKPSAADGFTQRIADAKRVPIDSLIEFNRSGFARCPFHTERTASFKYYPKDNHAHCFSCQRHADSIDITQQLHSCSFKEAVDILVG